MARTISLQGSDLAAGDIAKMRTVCTFAGMAKALLTVASNTGYTEEDVTIYCSQFKLKAKLLSKTEGDPAVKTIYGISTLTVELYTAADKKLLLQVTEPSTGTFSLVPAKGYLKV